MKILNISNPDSISFNFTYIGLFKENNNSDIILSVLFIFILINYQKRILILTLNIQIFVVENIIITANPKLEMQYYNH